MPHGLLAARLANEYAIGTRSGCFCAHPYMGRLLGLSDADVAQFHADVRAGNRHRLPGAVRVSANRQTYLTDIPMLGTGAARDRRITRGSVALRAGRAWGLRSADPFQRLVARPVTRLER